MNYGRVGVYKKRHELTSPNGKLGRKLILNCMKVAILGCLVLAVVGCCAVFGMFKGIIDTAPIITDITPSQYKTTILDIEGNTIEELIGSESNRIYVSIDQIPIDLQEAFIAIEDARFYSHNGIDPKGIMRAMWVAIKNGRLSEGASTLTQQLIKNNIFVDVYNEGTSEKIRRKFQEQYLALKLEDTVTKEVILENYLNTINLGNGNLGVQAAANNYFNKDVSELTLSEAAVIAGITQNPTRFNPVRYPENNATRRAKVLKDMLNNGFITEEEKAEAEADNVYARIQNVSLENTSSNSYSYFVDALISQVKADLMEQKGYTSAQADDLLYRGGLIINSTQNMDIQAILDEEFADPMNFPQGGAFTVSYSLTVAHPDDTISTYTEADFLSYFGYRTNNFSDSTAIENKIAQFETAMTPEGSEKLNSTVRLYPTGARVKIKYSLKVKNAENKTYTYNESSLNSYFIKDLEQTNYSSTYNNKAAADEYIKQFREAKVTETDTIIDEKVYYVFQPQASMTIIDQYTGKVLAIVGGTGTKEGSLTFSRATSSKRQPGSTFKPITTYAPALESGLITLGTVIDDEPYYYKANDKLVQNSDKIYAGLTTVRNAIALSRNIPAVKTLALVEPVNGLSFTQKFGFTTLVPPTKPVNGNHDAIEALALGGITWGVTNLELNSAYATIANSGYYNEPIYYTTVYDHDGNLILDKVATQKHSTVMKETTAALLTSALQSVTSYGTAGGGNVTLSGYNTAGKTGTTTGYTDIWFAGFTPYYTATIWMGNDDNKQLTNYGAMHLRLWGVVMKRIHELGDVNGNPLDKTRSFDIDRYVNSGELVGATICTQSGLLAKEGLCNCDERGNMLRYEYFEKGTEPTEYCDVHVTVEICSDTGCIATEHCKHTEEVVRIKKKETNIYIPEGETPSLPKDAEFDVNHMEECTEHTAPKEEPDNPGDLEGPDIPDIPEMPDMPDMPDIPDIPDIPGTED